MSVFLIFFGGGAGWFCPGKQSDFLLIRMFDVDKLIQIKQES